METSDGRHEDKDPRRINTIEEIELVYWTRTFAVTRGELLSAIQKVGNLIEDVRKIVGHPLDRPKTVISTQLKAAD